MVGAGLAGCEGPSSDPGDAIQEQTSPLCSHQPTAVDRIACYETALRDDPQNPGILKHLAGYEAREGYPYDAIYLNGAVSDNQPLNPKLAEVAAGGDEAAMKEQFGKTAKTCKGCHDDFKN